MTSGKKAALRVKRLATRPKSIGGRTLAARPLTSGGNDEIKILFRLAHELQAEISVLTPRERCPRDSVHLTIDPKLPIHHLKLILRPRLRIPFYEDFKLARSHPEYGFSVFQDSSTLANYGVKDMDTLMLIMEGFSLYPAFYKKLLSERCDNTFPLGQPLKEFIPLEQHVTDPVKAFRPVAEPGQLKIFFKIAHTFKRFGANPRDSVTLEVDPRMPIGLLKIKLRCRFWIPFNQGFELAHLSGPLLANTDMSTLLECAVKDKDTLLVLFDMFPLKRNLLFDRGYPLGEPNKMQIFIKSAHFLREHWRYPERSEDNRHIVRLTVEPTVTIGALKSMLKPYYWIPEENLVLFPEPATELNDGSSASKCTPIITTMFKSYSSTLDQCGIKEGHTLLACMEDGRFKMKVFDCRTRSAFSVCVSSCFETVRYLKTKIWRVKGYLPLDQVLTRPGDSVPLGDETTLVALGIVKPFTTLMEKSAYDLKIRIPKIMKKGFCS